MGGVKTISIIVAANIKGLEASLGKANKSITRFASNSARVGSALTFGLTAPITALGKSAFDTFSNFENEMMKVKTVTNATTSEFSMLTREAKRLGASTQFTASQVADLQLILGRKGFDPTAIQNMEGSILNLALATGEDLSLAANTVSSSLNAFQLDSEDASRVANTLASAAANSSLQLSTFATAFANAGASANAVGVDIEELSAMMGVLMDNGIKASKAGTGLNGLFIRLKENGISLSGSLDLLSQGELTLERATDLVGKNFSKQLLILAKNRDRTKELTTEFKTNTTRLDEMAEAMGSTTFAKVKKMQSAIEGLKLEVGALIADAIMPIIKFITDLAGKFGELDKSTQNLILAIGTFLAVLGPLILIVGGLGGAFAAGLAIIGPFLLAFAKFALIAAAIIVVLDKLILVVGGFFTILKDNSAFIGAVFLNLRKVIANAFIGAFNIILRGAKYLAKKLGLTLFENVNEFETEKLLPVPDFKNVQDSFTKFSKKYDKFKSDIGSNISSIFSFDGGGGSIGGVKEDESKDEPETRSLEEAYDAIFGKGAYQAFLLDQKLKQEAIERATRFKNALNELAVNTADSFATSFADVILSGQNLLKGLGQIFKDLAKQILAMIIKAAILSVLLSVTGLGSTQAATKMFGADQSFKGLLGGMFADGGRPPVGKMSLVGERGPELFVPGTSGTIIPNDALGGGTVIPDVKITGDDLLIVFDRANRRKVRR
tara:strand:+ start:4879 stop:7044 length:2166 start_codon:yes stop_codon:yes gene_type:complete